VETAAWPHRGYPPPSQAGDTSPFTSASATSRGPRSREARVSCVLEKAPSAPTLRHDPGRREAHSASRCPSSSTSPETNEKGVEAKHNRHDREQDSANAGQLAAARRRRCAKSAIGTFLPLSSVWFCKTVEVFRRLPWLDDDDCQPTYTFSLCQRIISSDGRSISREGTTTRVRPRSA
jgi:hypothetical protein